MGREFFAQDAERVARELLGTVLVRQTEGRILRARIVETEAYFDETDPASRACQRGDLRATMLLRGGTILVYGVHNNWLVNIVTGKEGAAEAVLIRAGEPLNFIKKCNGPGLLTKALLIDKSFHKKHILENDELLIDFNHKNSFETMESFRIGVKKDLPRKLRFYIKNSPYVSRSEFLNAVKSKKLPKEFSGIKGNTWVSRG